MNPQDRNGLMEKIRASLDYVKTTLTRDYSWRDIAGLNARMAYPNTRTNKVGATTSSLAKVSIVLAVARRQRMLLTALLLIALFAIASQLWLLPLTKTMQAQLELRPVQWAQLQQLIKVNQVSSPAGLSASTMSASSPRAMFVALLDESEIQKVRAVLAAHDIKPNLLRLSNDNPPKLEFQANEVLFSAWIEALNELRQVWRLYPENVSIIAGTTPGIVQVSSTLLQINAPAASRSKSLPQTVQQSSTPQSQLSKAP